MEPLTKMMMILPMQLKGVVFELIFCKASHKGVNLTLVCL